MSACYDSASDKDKEEDDESPTCELSLSSSSKSHVHPLTQPWSCTQQVDAKDGTVNIIVTMVQTQSIPQGHTYQPQLSIVLHDKRSKKGMPEKFKVKPKDYYYDPKDDYRFQPPVVKNQYYPLYQEMLLLSDATGMNPKPKFGLCELCGERKGMFGLKCENVARRCGHCCLRNWKTNNMIDLSKFNCVYPDCTRVAEYGHITYKRPTVCNSHRIYPFVLLSMILPNRCRICSDSASYGYAEDKDRIMCPVHALSDMVMIPSEICLFKGCSSSTCYGYEGEESIVCPIHRLDNMIYMPARGCLEDGCDNRSEYGLEWKKPEYCVQHMRDGMSNVVSKECTTEGCANRAVYGRENMVATHCKGCNYDDKSSDGLRCDGNSALHDITINVEARKCLEIGCPVQPLYGYEYGKALFCVRHQLDGMVRVCQKKRSNLD